MKRLVALGLMVLFGSTVAAGDWPQWRGPKRDGVSTETGLLKEWPKDGPKLVWKYPDAGLGFSAVAIRDGLLYTLGSRQDDEVVLVLDAATGKELWTAKIGPVYTFQGNVWGDGPRSTPTLDGDRLFALGAQGDLVAIDLTKKAEIWRKNLIKDFGGVMMTEWGYSESPLVVGDMVLVTPGGKKGLVVGLDKKTGALLWQSSEVAHKAPYSSIMPATIHGVPQLIQLSFQEPAGGFVDSFDAKTGKLLWQAPIFKGSNYAICPTPIVKDNLVYITAGYGGGCHTFEIDDKFKVKDLFSKAAQKKVKNTHGGVVLVDGKIYGHSERNGWVCQDLKTGAMDWEDNVTFETKSGSILAADGMLYLYGEEGNVALAKATPEGPTLSVVSEFKLPELSKYPKMRDTSRQSKAWSHPVIANGKLIIRDCEFIYCYDVKK
jgi:outer membrane protein assembly factor BamB